MFAGLGAGEAVKSRMCCRVSTADASDQEGCLALGDGENERILLVQMSGKFWALLALGLRKAGVPMGKGAEGSGRSSAQAVPGSGVWGSAGGSTLRGGMLFSRSVQFLPYLTANSQSFP